MRGENVYVFVFFVCLLQPGDVEKILMENSTFHLPVLLLKSLWE